jgi:hypothetical protein
LRVKPNCIIIASAASTTQAFLLKIGKTKTGSVGDNSHAIGNLTPVQGMLYLFVENIKKEYSMQAYCVKCKGKKEMKNAKSITMKNGKPATQGVCPTCGTKMFRIGKA